MDAFPEDEDETIKSMDCTPITLQCDICCSHKLTGLLGQCLEDRSQWKPSVLQNVVWVAQKLCFLRINMGLMQQCYIGGTKLWEMLAVR